MRALAVAVIIASAAPAFAAKTVEGAYKEALASYYKEDYAKASQLLERIVAVPMHDAPVFYSLGCSYYRQRDFGRAIYNFERALQIDPSFEDARYNLGIARDAVASGTEDVLKGAGTKSPWQRFVRMFTSSGWRIALLASIWAMVGLLLAWRFLAHGPLRAAAASGSVLAGLAALLFGIVLAASVQNARFGKAIVLPTAVEVHEGPDAETKSSFKIHAGLQVTVRAESAGWVRVRLANGLEGWVADKELGRL